MVDFNDARELTKLWLNWRELRNRCLGLLRGNALEVSEYWKSLKEADLIEVTLALAKEMLELAHVDADPSEMLASGKPREIFEKMVLAQGGDLSKGLPVAEFKKTIKASATGFLSKLDCRSVGIAAWRLGAGRARKEDPVSPTRYCTIKTGESVLELHGDKNDCFDYAIEALEGAIEISEVAPPASPLVLDKIFV